MHDAHRVGVQYHEITQIWIICVHYLKVTFNAHLIFLHGSVELTAKVNTSLLAISCKFIASFSLQHSSASTVSWTTLKWNIEASMVYYYTTQYNNSRLRLYLHCHHLICEVKILESKNQVIFLQSPPLLEF